MLTFFYISEIKKVPGNNSLQLIITVKKNNFSAGPNEGEILAN